MVVTFEWLQEEIAKILINDIRSGSITEREGESIAGFVLERIKQVKTEQDLIKFMGELGKEYDGFGNLQEIVHGRLQKHIEDKVANQMLQLVKSGKTKQQID